MARGHRIESVPELPLVISDSAESVEKTSATIKVLKQIGAYADAEKQIDSIYGSFDKSSEKKSGYVLPRSKMVNADLARIINSDEIQSVVRPIKKEVKRAPLKKNPLKNLNTMLRLNPYAINS